MSLGLQMLGEAFASLLRRRRLCQPDAHARKQGWVPASTAYEAASEELAAEWEYYVNTISHPVHAISLELGAFMLALARTVRPRRLLDLGSGFSSFVWRIYAREAGEPCEVVSIDDDAQWLERSGVFLRSRGLDDGQLLHWSRFVSSPLSGFDIILYDLGRMQRRFEALPQVPRLRSERGLIIFDDVHNLAYHKEVLAECMRARLRPYTLADWTFDRYGRYSALGVPREVLGARPRR